MPEQNQEYKPSTSGKVSAGIAASVVGYAAYKTHIHNKYPKPAQTPVKVPVAPSSSTLPTNQLASGKYNSTIRSLENSYRMQARNPPSRWSGGGSAIAAPIVGYVVGKVLKPLVVEPAIKFLAPYVVNAGISLDRATGYINEAEANALRRAVGNGEVRNLEEGIAYLNKLRSYHQKQLGLAYPPESQKIQIEQYPFTGGQGTGIQYEIIYEWQTYVVAENRFYPATASARIFGRIDGLAKDVDAANRIIKIQAICQGSTNGSLQPPGTKVAIHVQPYGTAENPDTRISNPKIISITRLDGQLDTSGNPPPTAIALYSPGAAILMSLDGATPSGENPSPPPALISQPGDFLHDGARAPLQRVLDGTTPPWARAENPVAKMPGTRILPAAPPIPAEIPQPDIAPSPNQDEKPINPYPFFDPVTFPDTTTPSQFDIKPAFTPNPLIVNPLSPTPLKATSLPSTGTPIQPNPTTRNPEPAPQTQPQPKTEPAPEKTSIEKLSDTFLPIATGIALLTPIVRGIAENTSPEKIIPLVKEGTCQSLNGGCTTGVNINQQVSNAANNSAAANALLQGADLALLGVIDSKLGAQIPNGGIGGFLQRAFQATRLDKILNALTFILALHNAAMLSRNLGATLGDLTSQALTTIGIKDENGSPLDINAEIGRQVNNLMSTILSAETWAGTKTAWNKANTILSSASQIVYTIRSIADSAREIQEWTASNLGKIGNALKRNRVVESDAYGHMSENVQSQNGFMLKIQRYRDGVDSIDDAASSFSGVLGEFSNITSEMNEFVEQKQRFDNAIKDAQPKTIPDNNPVKDKATAAKIASASPATQADVFRGEGETPNA